MPRERIHWELMRQASAKLNHQHGFGKVLSEQPRLSMLGAILPDVPYYLERGKSQDGNALGDFLHGRHGEDTFEPLRHWSSSIRELPETQQPASWALWAGFLSHCIVDQTFHPMVYWHTGDYHAPDETEKSDARINHRVFEVLLDSLVRERSLPSTVEELRSQVDWQSGAALHIFTKSIDPLFAQRKREHDGSIISISDLSAAWRQGLAAYSTIHRLAQSCLVGAGLRTIAYVSANRRFREISALCAFGRTAEASAYSKKVKFQNPVTAQALETSISDLMEVARARFLSELMLCDDFIEGRTSLQHAPLSVQGGTSLAYGVFGASDCDGKYFAPALTPFF